MQRQTKQSNKPGKSLGKRPALPVMREVPLAQQAQPAPSKEGWAGEWWKDGNYQLRTHEQTSDSGSQVIAVEIVDNPDVLGVVHGNVAIVLVEMLGGLAEAQKVADAIAADTDSLDKLGASDGVIDRRGIVAAPLDPTHQTAPQPATPFDFQTLIDPYNPPEPERVDFTYDDLYSEFEQTMQHVLDNLPFDHPVRRAYWRIWGPNRDENPNRNAVRQAVEMLYALPDDERQRALNGWNLSPAELRCDRAAAVKEASGNTIKSGMFLDSTDADSPMHRAVYPFPNGHTAPFTLIIAVGSRKMVVVDSLRALANKLEREWESLVGSPAGHDPAKDAK